MRAYISDPRFLITLFFIHSINEKNYERNRLFCTIKRRSNIALEMYPEMAPKAFTQQYAMLLFILLMADTLQGPEAIPRAAARRANHARAEGERGWGQGADTTAEEPSESRLHLAGVLKC